MTEAELCARIEIEQWLLGWQLASAPGSGLWSAELEAILPAFETGHDRIGNAIVAERRAGSMISPRQVWTRLESDAGLKEIGGLDYLIKLSCAAPAVADEKDAVRSAKRAINNLRRLSEEKDQTQPIAPELTIISAAEFDGAPVPPREDLVEGLIPRRAVTLLSGDGGTGKSLIALQLGVSLQLNCDWLGRRVRQNGPVLFLSAEDDIPEVHRRLDAIRAERQTSFDQLAGIHILSLVGQDALLGTLAAPNIIESTLLFRRIEDATRSLRPALVAIDTLSDTFGGNENERGQARQFIGLLRGLALRCDTTILLLAHPSLTGMNSGSGISGSTGWNAAVRSRLYFQRIKDDDGAEHDADARVLRCMKANYGPTGLEVRVRWQCGVFVSCAAGESHTAPDAESMFLKMLDSYTTQGRFVGPHPSANYAPAIFARDKQSGLSKRRLTQAMNDLFARGAIKTIESGPTSRRVKRIVRVIEEGE